MYEQLKKEFIALQKEELGSSQTTVALFMGDGELSEEDREFMEKHPEYHYIICQKSDQVVL